MFKKAFNEGYWVGRSGQSNNPYPIATLEWAEWRVGNEEGLSDYRAIFNL